MRRRIGWILVVGLGAAGAVTGVSSAFAGAAGPHADLRVDADRDGRIDLVGDGDERAEDRATALTGALFLANVDDDQHRCPVTGPDGKDLPDAQLEACSDGADTVVNGPKDAEDLARIRSVPMRSLSDGATGTVAVVGPGAAHTHLFLARPGGWRLVTPADRLDAAELRRGVELGIEGTDVIRDAAVWDGRAQVTLSVTADGATTTDSVAMHEAPLLTNSPVQQARQLMVTRVSQAQADASQNPDLAAASAQFIAGLTKAGAAAGIAKAPFEFTKYADEFPQDFFEPMYESMPGLGGRPQTIRVLLRSPQQDWRPAGRELYERLRGPDVAVIDNAPDPGGVGGIGDTLSSDGNLETIPPYSYHGHDYPAGRIVMGEDPANHQTPSPGERTLLAAQGVQDPLLLDTSFTFVQHVDESIQFLPADTPRGWRLAIADPTAGIAVLRAAQAAGHGAVSLFAPGKDYTDRLVTIDDYVNDPQHVLVDDNARAARATEKNVAVLKRETGLRDDEIVRVPVLFGSADLLWGRDPDSGFVSPLTALLPDAVNGVILGRHTYLAPEQWGPTVAGTDIMGHAVAAAYRAAGMGVTFIDDWRYSIDGGDVHCATNVLRDDTAAWWRR